MTKFKVGDRVSGEDGGKPFTGTIVESAGNGRNGTIKRDDGKTGSGCHIEGYGEGWAYYEASEYKLKLIKPTIMQNIGNMMKRLLDADSQTLYKAGYLNSDLEMTDKGKLALTAILFMTNKAAVVAEAQAELDEEAKQK